MSKWMYNHGTLFLFIYLYVLFCSSKQTDQYFLLLITIVLIVAYQCLATTSMWFFFFSFFLVGIVSKCLFSGIFTHSSVHYDEQLGVLSICPLQPVQRQGSFKVLKPDCFMFSVVLLSLLLCCDSSCARKFK